MADTQHPTSSKTDRFIRGAGEVREDPEHRLWGPAKWVVQLIQYLVAIVIVTIGEGMKAIIKGEKPKSKRHAH
jgi:hypothetical protein